MKVLSVFALCTLVSAILSFAQTETYDNWIKTARIGGLALEPGANTNEIDVLVASYRDQGVSVIELDSGLSNYLDAAGFATQVAHINLVSQRAHAIGLKVVIYFPSLEVLTPNGANIPNTMGKDHPDWLQVGMNGTSNVFYGTQEHWVPPSAESAWMSANSPGYRNYFIGRVQQLAGSAVDGIWIDVPLYLDTGVQWSDVRPEAVAAFETWSAAKGYNYSGAPTSPDITNQKFRHWLKWRNDNLAEFVDDVRAAAVTTNPDWAFVTEIYPLDYLDTIWTGLEPAVHKRADNSIVVWELDGLSDSLGMEYANLEDFSNLIAMSKMAKAFDRERPGWGFSYGNLPTDAGLVMAATVSAQLSPFETKTPIMTSSVGSDFRTKWFEFVRDNEEALLKTPRMADVGVWFSPDTKTFHDFAQGGVYGMYLDQNPPPGAESWWAVLPELSLRNTDHLSGWRGAAYALNDLHVPYKAVVDPGDPTGEMEGLSLMWLPSVTSISDASAQLLRDFVNNGGTLLATGLVPGTMDEHGAVRSASNLADVFGFTSIGAAQGARMQKFGQGAAIFRPDIKGVDLFETGGAAGAAAKKEINHGQIEQIVRIHTPDRIIADELQDGIHISLSEATATEQHAFVLNYTGLQEPAVLKPTRVPFHFFAPEGFRVTGAQIKRPGSADLSGTLPVARSGASSWMVEPMVDQFAIVTFQLAAVAPSAPSVPPALQFATQEREDTVNDALNFVVNQMRHSSAPAPFSYGVRTNLIDNNLDTAVYTGGHHVTDEHMGLFLRVTALMQNQGRYDEALQFVKEVLFSEGYHVLAWSMHKDKLQPFLQPDLLNNVNVWLAANAPLDDLRSVRGFFDGAAAFGQSDTSKLAHKVLDGMYWTSVTDRIRGQSVSRPQYPGGLIGYSWDWEDHDDATLTPPSVGTGHGRLGTDLIPVDYQDLGTLAMGARKNPRLRSVIASAVDMMLAAEIPGVPGLYYNGLDANNQWTGDFEFPGERQGNNLKVIQELWTALHLARVSKADAYVLDETRRIAAAAAAQRSLAFFKGFYQAHGNRVPEYLTFAGADVPDGNTGNSLVAGVENLTGGEARIYSQLARLALLFGDDAFAASVIEDKILTDRVTDPASPLFGFIGASTASSNDAEAFNVLESLLTLCLEAQPDTAPPANTAPVALPDLVQGGMDMPLLIPAVDLLGNDGDPEDDVLTLFAVDAVTAQGGTIVRQGTRWLYTPPSGFLGDDTFNYSMTDGSLTASSSCTIQVSEGGGVQRDIQRDGDLADWPPGHLVVADPDDISGSANLIDIREIHVTVENNKLWLAYVNEGPVVYNWAYLLYIDADKNPATGYQVGDIGAEYILEENMLQIYTGTGVDWSWQLSAVVTPAIVGDTVELAIPLGSLGGSAAVRMYFIGDNLAYEPNGIGEDLVPDPNPNGQWIYYDTVLNQGSVGDLGNNVPGIDGDLSDWPAGHFVALDPNDVSGSANKLDLRELHVRSENGKLLLGYVNEEEAIYNYAYLLYVDADSNPATGFQFDDLGVDFIIQDNQIQAYSGTGATWAWTPVEAVSAAVLNNTVELSASLAAMGNPTNVRLQFFGDNTAYVGGTAIDYVPDQNGANADTYIQFNTVTSTGSVGGAPDTDSIPDAWEIANGLNPSVNDSLFDPESDGVPSIVEWALDQSPLMPDVEPLLISLVEVGDEVEVTVDYRYTDGAEALVSIALEKASDPVLGPWTVMPAPSPDPPVAGVVNVSVKDDETFNRVTGIGPLAQYFRLRVSGTEGGQAFNYVSPMVGYNRVRCLVGSDTHTGMMFRQAAVYRADCSAAPTAVGSTGLWKVAYAAQPVGMAAGQSVRFETGALAGQALRVASVSASGFEVEGNLSSVVVGDRYRVAPSWTLDALLAMAGTVLEDSSDFLGINRGNEILFFDQQGSGVSRSAAGAYYHLPAGWRSSISPTLSQNNRRIDPDAAIIVRSAGPQVVTQAWVVIAGAEVDSPITTTIGAGGTDTIVTMQSATAVKLRDVALVSSGAFEGSADTQSANRRDLLMVYDNAVAGLNKTASATYYYDLSANAWRSEVAPTADAGDVQLVPGAFLRIRSASGAAASWMMP